MVDMCKYFPKRRMTLSVVLVKIGILSDIVDVLTWFDIGLICLATLTASSCCKPKPESSSSSSSSLVPFVLLELPRSSMLLFVRFAFRIIVCNGSSLFNRFIMNSLCFFTSQFLWLVSLAICGGGGRGGGDGVVIVVGAFISPFCLCRELVDLAEVIKSFVVFIFNRNLYSCRFMMVKFDLTGQHTQISLSRYIFSSSKRDLY
jgi:hypothetical protein